GRESIKVLVRIRPLLAHEIGPAVVQEGEENMIRVTGALQQLHCRYDAVIGADVSQEGMFSHVRECTSAVLRGENSTIFAYGQTGSGKTYTMFGSDSDGNNGGAPSAHAKGVIPLAVADLFERLVRAIFSLFGAMYEDHDNASVWMSLVQLYNEQLYDMLRDPQRVHPLAIHEEEGAGIYVQGLSEYAVNSAGECLQLLRVGREHRAIRETHMNQASSRSHSIFQIVVEQKRQSEEGGECVLRSKFNLVDLAGSEKWDVKQEMEEVRVSEMTNINVSLYTLGRVIATLCRSEGGSLKGHIPYRDSKLTRLLQDSLGGNTRTRIIATLSPAKQCLDESISTLRFADRAKQVMTFVRVNEQRPVDHALVHRLQAEVKHLRRLLRETAGERGLQNETPTTTLRPAALTALAEAQKLGYQETIKQLRRENTALREKLHRNVVVNGPGNQEQTGLDVDALQAANRTLKGAIEHIVVNVRRFFRFEVEEEDLRGDIADVLTGLNGSVLDATTWCEAPKCARRNSSRVLAGASAAQRGRNLHDSDFLENRKDGGRGKPYQQEEISLSERITLPPVSGVAPEKEARPGKLAYRLRGKHADEVVVVMRREATEEDEERQLRKDLKLAKERMKKNIQLQEWLLQKERMEKRLLEDESIKRNQVDRDRRRKDEEFRRRAAKQKAKLKRFYETAQLEAKEEERHHQELTDG
ncbi:unnamed protein product, partial [Scytosiphon promiscuus]